MGKMYLLYRCFQTKILNQSSYHGMMRCNANLQFINARLHFANGMSVCREYSGHVTKELNEDFQAKKNQKLHNEDIEENVSKSIIDDDEKYGVVVDEKEKNYGNSIANEGDVMVEGDMMIEDDLVIEDELENKEIQMNRNVIEKSYQDINKEYDEILKKYHKIHSALEIENMKEQINQERESYPYFYEKKLIPSAPFGIEPPSKVDIEESNSLFISNVIGFKYSAGEINEIPERDHNIPEVAFFGRSNVGKSSLINAVLDSEEAARVSKKPGHTKRINFYTVGDHLYVVDLPGYGFAEGNRDLITQWQDLVIEYVTKRDTLMKLFILIDARHGVTQQDEKILKILKTEMIPYQIILTKCDYLNNHDELVKVIKNLYTKMRRDKLFSHCYPVIIPTSSQLLHGIGELRAHIYISSGIKERLSLLPPSLKEKVIESLGRTDRQKSKAYLEYNRLGEELRNYGKSKKKDSEKENQKVKPKDDLLHLDKKERLKRIGSEKQIKIFGLDTLDDNNNDDNNNDDDDDDDDDDNNDDDDDNNDDDDDSGNQDEDNEDEDASEIDTSNHHHHHHQVKS